MQKFFTDAAHAEPGTRTLYLTLTTSTGGTLVAATTRGRGILSVTKTNTGRYRVVFKDRWKRLMYCNAVIVGTTSAATPASKAVDWKLRNILIPSATNSVDLQFMLSLADAELEDGAQALVVFHLSASTVGG